MTTVQRHFCVAIHEISTIIPPVQGTAAMGGNSWSDSRNRYTRRHMVLDTPHILQERQATATTTSPKRSPPLKSTQLRYKMRTAGETTAPRTDTARPCQFRTPTASAGEDPTVAVAMPSRVPRISKPAGGIITVIVPI